MKETKRSDRVLVGTVSIYRKDTEVTRSDFVREENYVEES